MADPDMEEVIEGKTAHAWTYQNDYVGIYQEVRDPEDPLQVKLDAFLVGWL